MLQSIDISEFRGVRECETPLELSDFTVLIGRNNSGKSTALEALHVLKGGGGHLFGYGPVDFVKNLHSGKSLAYRYSGQGSLVYNYAGEQGRTEVGSNINQRKAPSGFTGRSILYPSTDQYMNRAYDRLQRNREKIEKDEAHIRVAEFINQCISDTYTEIYLETLEARKKPDGANPFWVDIDDLGNGLVQTIPIFLSIEAFEPDMFLWDDMGTSLHPSLMNEVLRWLSEQDSQIVAATHSIDVLSSLLEVRPNNTTLLQLSKSGDDILQHSSLDLEELELMMENAGHDPRYLSDELQL